MLVRASAGSRVDWAAWRAHGIRCLCLLTWSAALSSRAIEKRGTGLCFADADGEKLLVCDKFGDMRQCVVHGAADLDVVEIVKMAFHTP